MDKTKSGCFGAAGTYVPFFATLCTAASDKQRERARVGFIHIAQTILRENEFRNRLLFFLFERCKKTAEQTLPLKRKHPLRPVPLH